MKPSYSFPIFLILLILLFSGVYYGLTIMKSEHGGPEKKTSKEPSIILSKSLSGKIPKDNLPDGLEFMQLAEAVDFFTVPDEIKNSSINIQTMGGIYNNSTFLEISKYEDPVNIPDTIKILELKLTDYGYEKQNIHIGKTSANLYTSDQNIVIIWSKNGYLMNVASDKVSKSTLIELAEEVEI